VPAGPASKKAKVAATGPGAKKGKKERDPNAPKNPKTAFLLFCVDMRPQTLKEVNIGAASRGEPPVHPSQITVILSERWGRMTEDEKRPWRDRAEEDRQRYIREKALYMPTQPVRGRKTKPKPVAVEEDYDHDAGDAPFRPGPAKRGRGRAPRPRANTDGHEVSAFTSPSALTGVPNGEQPLEVSEMPPPLQEMTPTPFQEDPLLPEPTAPFGGAEEAPVGELPSSSIEVDAMQIVQ